MILFVFWELPDYALYQSYSLFAYHFEEDMNCSRMNFYDPVQKSTFNLGEQAFCLSFSLWTPFKSDCFGREPRPWTTSVFHMLEYSVRGYSISGGILYMLVSVESLNVICKRSPFFKEFLTFWKVKYFILKSVNLFSQFLLPKAFN